MDLFDQEKITKSETPVQIANEVSEFLNKTTTSYRYTSKNFASYNERKDVIKQAQNKHYFAKNIYYVTKLVHHIRTNETNESLESPLKETRYWNDKGKLCFFASVLLYHLLIYDDVFESKDLKYVQGFYRFHIPKDHFLKMFGVFNWISGAHAFLHVHGAVIDVSVQQVYDNIDDYEPHIILGENHTQDIELYGYQETAKTIKKYAYRMAKKQGKTINEWIRHHHEKSEE